MCLLRKGATSCGSGAYGGKENNTLTWNDENLMTGSETILTVQSAEGKSLMYEPPIWDGVLPLFVSFCFVLFPFLLRLLSRHLRQRVANRTLRPLDLSALHTLTDRDDEGFLREVLSQPEFFRFKRLRIRVTWKYVRCLANNSATVRRLAAGSRHDPDVNVAQTARELARLASRIRAQSLLAFAKLTVEYMLPAVRLRRYKS